MYTTANAEFGATSSVPAFLSKLWTLVDDASTNDLITWGASGKSFHVLDQSRFSKEILPLYFKHNNMASFIRQLNMYGFRKVIAIDAANIKMEKDDVEFAHPCFIQGQEELLEFIKRKVPNPKSSEGGSVPHATEDLTKVYSDVAAMKGRQDSMTSKLEHLKIENEVLWKELVSLRQRHFKQEQIVNKLIQFLVTLVGDRTLGGTKRKFPLMLQDTASSNSSVPTKIPRMDGAIPDDQATVVPDLSNKTANMEPLAILKDASAPSLQLTDLLEDVEGSPIAELFGGDDGSFPIGEGITSDMTLASALTEETPLAKNDLVDADIPLFVSTSDPASSPITTVATTDNALCGSEFDKCQMTTHLDNLQSDIDSIRDLFLSGQYSFDSGTLFELFSPDPSLLTAQKVLFSPDASSYLTTPNLFLDGEEENEAGDPQKVKSKNDSNGAVVGNELIQYNPPDDFNSIFDQFNSEPTTFSDDVIDFPAQDALENLFDSTQLLSGSGDLDLQ